MRWPRRRHHQPSSAPGGPGDAQPAPGDAPVARRPVPRRRDWATLPPLAGVAPAPLTAPVLEFVAALATSQTLVHRSSPPLANLSPPNGLLHVRPVDSPAPGAENNGAPEPAAPEPPLQDAAILTPLPPLRRVRSVEIARPDDDGPLVAPDPRADRLDDLGAAAAPPPLGTAPPPLILSPDRVPPPAPVPGPRPVPSEADAQPESLPPAASAPRRPPIAAPPRARPNAPGPPAVPPPSPSFGPTPDPGQPSAPEGATIRHLRPNLAQSRRMGLGPGYHGPLPEAIRLERAERQPTPPPPMVEPVAPTAAPLAPVAPTTAPVPDTVRNEIRAAHGVDVNVIHQGPEVSVEARRMGARAFTRGGEVFIPPEAGPLDTPEGHGLVGHELTHVVQQRRTGRALPPEDSPSGQALEAEAQSAERFFRGDAGAPRPAPPPEATGDIDNTIDEARALMQRLVAEGFAVSDGGSGIVFNHPTSSGPTPGVQRQTAPADTKVSNSFAAVGHSIMDDLISFGEDIMTSTFGLDQSTQDDMAQEKNIRERQFYSDQFKELRLEHRIKEERAKPGNYHLDPSDEARLKAEAEKETTDRLNALDDRIKARLDKINKDRTGEEVVKSLDTEAYARVVHHLFDNPEGAMPADDDADINAAVSEVAKSHPASSKGGTKPGAGGAKDKPASGAASKGGGAAKAVAAGVAAGAGAGLAKGSLSDSKAKEEKDKAKAKEKAEDDKWGSLDAVRASLVGDLAGIGSDLFGLTLSDDELAAAEGKKPAAAAGAGAGEKAAAAGAAVPIGGKKGDVAASGHELLDLDHIDIEELSHRLYERLRGQLRRELLIDRERAGMLTDFR